MEEQKKSLWKSKTLWLNLIVAVAAFMPGMGDKLNPDSVAVALAGLNILLRLVSKDKLYLS